MDVLRFVYRSERGETTERELSLWKESGFYIHEIRDGKIFRTFRKDRIIEYVAGGEAHLAEPFAAPPPKLSARDDKLQILFTGFPKVQRAVLEAKAAAHGLHVCKSVTNGLMFLCGGPNAGPAKLEKARSQHVYIIKQHQFLQFVETGELPDEDSEF